jgi:hypothetical protein
MKNDIPTIPNGFTLITDLPVPGVTSRSQVRVLYNLGGRAFEFERDLPYLEADSESYLLRVSFIDMAFMVERIGQKSKSFKARLFSGEIRTWVAVSHPLIPPREHV